MEVRFPHVVATALLALLGMAGVGAAQTCTDSCKVSDSWARWSRGAKRECRQQCELKLKNCDGEPFCEAGALTCAMQCVTTWGGPKERSDRRACQRVCNQCAPAGRGFCVSIAGPIVGASLVARCCGGDSGRPCCGIGILGVPICCGARRQCCDTLPGQSACLPIEKSCPLPPTTTVPTATTTTTSNTTTTIVCPKGLLLCLDLVGTGFGFPTCYKPNGLCCPNGLTNSGPEFVGGICCVTGPEPNAFFPYPAGHTCCAGAGTAWACPGTCGDGAYVCN